MAKVMQLDEVLNSKVYVHEKSKIAIGSPRQFIEPFLEKFVNLQVEWKVEADNAVINKEQSSEVLNEAYGRVSIQAKFPQSYCAYEHDSTIGLVYALDTAKPNIRVYSGQNAWACTNLAIFGARYVHEVDIMGGFSSVYEKGLEYVDGLTKQLARFQTIYERMNDTFYQHEEIDKALGYILREAYRNKQIGTNPVLGAIKLLEDNNSRYAIRDNKTSQWNMYSALTQYVTDKVDIVEKASKTIMISNLFVKEV